MRAIYTYQERQMTKKDAADHQDDHLSFRLVSKQISKVSTIVSLLLVCASLGLAQTSGFTTKTIVNTEDTNGDGKIDSITTTTQTFDARGDLVKEVSEADYDAN